MVVEPIVYQTLRIYLISIFYRVFLLQIHLEKGIVTRLYYLGICFRIFVNNQGLSIGWDWLEQSKLVPQSSSSLCISLAEAFLNLLLQFSLTIFATFTRQTVQILLSTFLNGRVAVDETAGFKLLLTRPVG